MDAQNAAESIATKPSASASPSSRPRIGSASEVDHPAKSSSSTPPVKKFSAVTVPVTSPPAKEKDPRHSATASQQHGPDDDAAAENNSEAETIVLAGKDGSPVKSRKVIKREDNSDDDRRGRAVDDQQKRKSSDGKTESNAPVEGTNGAGHAADAAKRKRLMDQPRNKESSMSSPAPTLSSSLPQRQAADGRPGSDSESVHAKFSKPPTNPKDFRDKEPSKSKSGDRLVPHKRKAPRGDSDDEAEHEVHKVRRQRTSASIDASSSLQRPHQKDRDHPKLTSSKTTHEAPSRHRSTSPHPRTHRRSASTQIVSQSSSGLSQKKKRVPPPLATDYPSDESSASGSPHVRSSTARGLATPATAESAMSSAKNPAHKKHVDAHGQTQLAKACSNGNYENVKKRLLERPQDLNLPDYAGNTPLQIAAINGHVEIVRLLVESGCDIDCVNHDKDTPLLDAVDNGHLDVIKVLLDAGVNPRKANVNGQEPLDRVDDDLDNAEEIRAALIEARKKVGGRRKTSEERPDHLDTRSSHGAESPRRSPAVAEPASSSRRAASSRSHKLSNQMLYLHMTDDKTMRAAAGRGEVETVERILQVRERVDDAESMVAAARGGHDIVMSLLLAIGGCNPDPPPIRSVPEDVATPILAAIGQENIKVIHLLLAQSDFDPTKKYRGETYYEIARRRQGPNWKDEEQVLKDAYDAYKKSHRDPSKKSPSRREQEAKRSGRAESREEPTKTPKRKATSPSHEGVRAASKARTVDKDHKAAGSHATKSDDLTSPKRGPGRPKKDDRGMPTIAISDGETSPPAAKVSKSKRPDPDTAALSSEGEAKPRKRLMSGRDLKEQREKNRRASMVSNSSSLREPSSPRDARYDDSHEPPTEKYHDRAKALKRDESRDRLSVSGDHSSKRSRTSATPDHGTSEKEGEPVKKRRLDMDKKERLPKPSASPDRNRKSAPSRDAPGTLKHDDKPTRKHGDQLEKRDSSKPRRVETTSDQSRRESGKPVSSEKSIHVKSEDPDTVMRDAGPSQSDESKARAREEEKKRRAELEAKRKEKEKEAKEKEAKEKEAKEKEAKEKEAEERKRREEEEKRQAEAKKRKEEEEEKKRIEEEERKREEETRKRREEEEAQQRKEKEEEEQRQAARIRREKEEEEQRKREEEEERVRKEQEAAEEARRKREEEERREQERRVREEHRQRRLREEQEKKRLERLPASLRWLDRSTNAKTPEMAKRWRLLRGVRFDSIKPETAGTAEGREQWVLNTQVAMLLGESDLQLSRFSGWNRVPASLPAKHLVMGLATPGPALISHREWDLGREIPGYYFGKAPEQMTRQELRQLENEAKTKFLALDLFFVKLSDLMFAIPNIPHLRNLEIVVSFNEVAETMEKHDNLEFPARWKDDPDAARYMGFCPRNKYFINGQFVREDKVDTSSASRTPWPEARVPRDGLTAVPPTDPNYARLAKEQGLEHLLSGLRTPPMIGAQTSPSRLFSQRAFGGLSPPQSESTATDGHQPRSSTSSTGEQDKPLVNGNTGPALVENGAHGNS